MSPAALKFLHVGVERGVELAHVGGIEQAQDAVRGAEATLAQAQSDYKRDKPLFDQQVITPYDFEHTQTNLKTAEANLHRLQQAEQDMLGGYKIVLHAFCIAFGGFQHVRGSLREPNLHIRTLDGGAARQLTAKLVP